MRCSAEVMCATHQCSVLCLRRLTERDILLSQQRYPLMWQGLLCLKNDNATVQMHFLSGNQRLVEMALPQHTSEGPQPLRIAQRMRLEQTQLDGVSKRMVVRAVRPFVTAIYQVPAFAAATQNMLSPRRESFGMAG